MYEFLKSIARRVRLPLHGLAFLEAQRLPRVVVLQVAQAPEAAKGLAKTRGVIRGTMAGIMETNATSGAKHAVLLLKEYRSFRVSSHCLTDSAKQKVGGDGPRSCCSCISRLKFRKRVPSAAFLLYGSRD